MTKPQLIGVMGQRGAGKDSFAEALLPHGYVRLAFADAVKEAVLALDPYGDRHSTRLSALVKVLGWDEAKRQYPEVRRLIQNYGTGARDTFGKDVWLRIVERQIHRLQQGGKHVVVSDVRFLNEAQMITDNGGWLVRIFRPELDDSDEHVSEHEWRTVSPDFMVGNDGPLEELGEAAAWVAEFLSNLSKESAL